MRRILFLMAGLALVPASAYAHPGGSGASGFLDGVLHPFSGVDHLTAAVLAGALSGLPRIGARLAFSFLGGVAMGMIWGAKVQIGAAGLELGILASLGALGAAYSLGRVPAGRAWSLGAAAGFVHGAAHGFAGPSLSLAFGLGVMSSMVALVTVSWQIQSNRQQRRAK